MQEERSMVNIAYHVGLLLIRIKKLLLRVRHCCWMEPERKRAEDPSEDNGTIVLLYVAVGRRFHVLE